MRRRRPLAPYPTPHPPRWPGLAGSVRRTCAGSGNGARIRPRRQEVYQNQQKDEGKYEEHNRSQQALARGKGHFISGVAEKTLGKKLAADYDVPAHGENPDDGERSGERVDAFADRVGQLQNLRDSQQRNGSDRAKENLDDDLRGPEPG